MAAFLLLFMASFVEPPSVKISSEWTWGDIQYSPDGRRLVAWKEKPSAVLPSEITVWSVVDDAPNLPKVKQEYSAKFDFEIHGVAFVEPETLVVQAGYHTSSRKAKPTEKVFNSPTVFLAFPTLKEIARWPGLDRTPHEPGCLIRHSADGKLLFHNVAEGGGKKDSRIRILDRTTGEERGAIPFAREDSSSGRGIFVAGDDRQTRVLVGGFHRHTLWRVDREGNAIRVADAAYPALIGSLALDKPGNLVAVGLMPLAYNNKQHSSERLKPTAALLLWDLETRRMRTLSSTERVLLPVNFSPDSARLATGSVDGLVTLWNVGTGERIGRFKSAGCRWIKSLSFSPDSQFLVVSGVPGEYGVFSAPGASGGEEAAPVRLFRVADLLKADR